MYNRHVLYFCASVTRLSLRYKVSAVGNTCTFTPNNAQCLEYHVDFIHWNFHHTLPINLALKEKKCLYHTPAVTTLLSFVKMFPAGRCAQRLLMAQDQPPHVDPPDRAASI